MRWILAALAAFALFTGALVAFSALNGAEALTVRRAGGLALVSAGLLMAGLVLVTGPLWLVLRRRIGARPVAWTAIGFIATIVPTALMFALILHVAEGFARMATGAPPAAPTDWGRLALQLVVFALGGALAYLAGWTVWRRSAVS